MLATTTMAFAWQARAEPERLSPVHDAYPAPKIAFDEEPTEPASDDSLSAAIADAFASNPELAARRYDLRATDDEVGVAMSQTRPNVQLQVSGGYDLTLPGQITQSNRSLADRLANPNIERNDITSQFVVDQPVWTGGRAASALRAATASSAAGRETLRGAEGDMLVDLIAAYSDVRRDRRSLAIRRRNLQTLDATLAEIVARREAGELTRTDIAQAETQLEAARVQVNAAEAQLESSRASFVTIVGREPGNLAPEPDLPGLPGSADEAFALAEVGNPELAAALATARASRERIAVAEAEGRPELSLRGTAGTTGPAVPFDRADHDVTFTGRATLTIPLFAGGRVRSLVDQARNRESADTLRVEAARRQLVEGIVNAWNQWVTADRNVRAQELQARAARIYYEGTLEEYREGLRSTFDVLYAQNSLSETEIALLGSKRDRYLAQAILLRRLGRLEADRLILEGPGYDPDIYLRRVRQRSAVPWGGALRAIDKLGAPGGKPQALEAPERTPGTRAAPAQPGAAPAELLRGAQAGTGTAPLVQGPR
ncbi:TolC family outer membrane protein [Sphingopyxis sp. GC21]|uniref:TolC family outer membrane protein n=1 Tax=Sphingopyxis sp. GC21 TaxID=2933562 RepID=UPI0021E3C688|nr:TolC family outer membrane protein [Sphingopyxis sp. GC21]